MLEISHRDVRIQDRTAGGEGFEGFPVVGVIPVGEEDVEGMNEPRLTAAVEDVQDEDEGGGDWRGSRIIVEEGVCHKEVLERSLKC